jgi:hypothetical protein
MVSRGFKERQYPLVYPLVFEKAKKKVEQVADRDASSIVAVGIWHKAASYLLFGEDEPINIVPSVRVTRVD